MSTNISPENVQFDREVRFDLSKPFGTLFFYTYSPFLISYCRPIHGEEVILTVSNVEDVKGGHEEMGTLFITNLRFLWTFSKDDESNLCFNSPLIHPSVCYV